MVARRKSSSGNETFVVVGTLTLGAVAFEIRRGLMATVQQAEAAASTLVGPAYAALARELGLHADRPEQRELVVRRLQQAWHEWNGGEPARVKARRLALIARMIPAPRADEQPRRAAKARTPGPTVASLVRKALLEGAETDAVVASVKLWNPSAKIDAGTVAFYRHQLKKKGELA